MSFIQYADRKELDKDCGKNAGFVSPDHRVYTEIELIDEFGFYSLPAETVLRLHDLQLDLQMYSDSHESNFTQVVEDAENLRKSFRAALKAIKFKPIERRKR